MTHCDNGFPKRNVKKNWHLFSILNLNWKLNGKWQWIFWQSMIHGQLSFGAFFFSTIWRFCVLILSPIGISFATPTKMVSMFLTIQFHPSTACLNCRAFIGLAFIFLNFLVFTLFDYLRAWAGNQIRVFVQYLASFSGRLIVRTLSFSFL